MPRSIKKTPELQEQYQKPGSEHLSESEFEELLFESSSSKPSRTLNLLTVAGVGTLGAIILYLLEQIGVLDLGDLNSFFFLIPLIGGLLILFSTLFPKKRKRTKPWPSGRRTKKRTSTVDPIQSTGSGKQKWNLPSKTHKKLLAGVCGGLARKMDINPNAFRFLFLLATFAGAGPFTLPAYLVMALIMPSPDHELEQLE